jgi:PIN domain nuclease of toxin-antitoxin system
MPRSRAEAPVGPVVLDTHAWIWMLEGVDSELSPATISFVEEAGGQAQLAVSAISVWELAMLEAKGRITLSRSIEEWVKAALTAPGLRLVDLTPEISLESTRLPGSLHGDLSDRMIVATARVLGGTLITCDHRILAYGSEGHVRVRDGRKRS